MSGFTVSEVNEPILNSPFEKPTRYWYIKEGEPPILADGRRRDEFAERLSRRLEGEHEGEVTTEWLEHRRSGVLVDPARTGRARRSRRCTRSGRSPVHPSRRRFHRDGLTDHRVPGRHDLLRAGLGRGHPADLACVRRH